MSKSKPTSKGAKPAKSGDILTKVKDAAVTKPAQAIKAKSKELAKVVAGKEEKKEKKNKKKAKEPTPEPSESEESDSSESSESESEVKASATKEQPKKAAAKTESSDDSDSDSNSDSEESEVEAPKANGSVKKNGTTTARADSKAHEPTDGSDSESDSDDSMADAAAVGKAQSDEDSEDNSSDDSSADEKPVKKAASKAVKDSVKNESKHESASEDNDDADSESSDSEDEIETAPKTSKRKAEEEVDQNVKKSKTETVDTSKGANLFVGNLSWNVDEAWLREVFEEFGELSGVRIMTDRQSGRSKGFGYVEFVRPEDAAKAHAAKAGADLDGRTLNVDFANARPDNSQKQENRRKSYGDQVSEPSDTLFLGNLSFEVGQETVTEAFAPHGQIRGIRLPTDRETGNPKGFGYVTFASVDEAKFALDAMQGAYIEGRPVRIDYSSPRPQNSDSPARGRGGFGGRGGSRGGRGGRGGNGFARGGRGGGRGGSTNRGGFGDFSGRKTSFD